MKRSPRGGISGGVTPQETDFLMVGDRFDGYLNKDNKSQIESA